MLDELIKHMKLFEDDDKPRDEKGRVKHHDITYDEEDKGKVTAHLRSYNSAAYTKLGNNLKRIEALENELKALRKETKDDVKDLVADLFSAQDEALTRVIKTKKFIFTLSKKPKESETYKYSAILEELATELTPQLKKLLEELRNKHRSVTQSSPKLKVDSISENISPAKRQKVKEYFGKLKAFVDRWGRVYDNNLAKLKRAAGY